MVAALVIFLGINIASHMGLIHFKIPVIGEASSATLVMGGIVISGVYEKLVGKGKDQYLWSVLTAAGALAIVAGFVIRPYADGISKIRATPAWVLICAGITILVFELLIWLVDFKGKQKWFSVIRPGGTSTLTCYLIPYFQYSLFVLLHVHYPAFLNQGAGGLLRSFATALLIIALVGYMERYRLRLKI